MRTGLEHTNLIYCDFLTIFKWYLDLQALRVIGIKVLLVILMLC